MLYDGRKLCMSIDKYYVHTPKSRRFQGRVSNVGWMYIGWIWDQSSINLGPMSDNGIADWA